MPSTQTPSFKNLIRQGIPDELPQAKALDAEVAHAPARNIEDLLTLEDKKLAIRNALRYFPSKWHSVLAPEFAEELHKYGRIYMHRFRPQYPIYARGIDEYPHKCKHAAAIMLMIQNNLDPLVAKYPHELITYGGNGAVFQNWAQYLITMRMLSEMTDEQTLALYSGHPMGLFPSSSHAPRVVVTNGMMIPNYSKVEDWNKYNALGVTQYGQMTAGSFMYIGPQGIVHGTTITLLNAGRKKALGDQKLNGALYITSGLGGMSGAQSLAAEITGCVGVIAEVDSEMVNQRLQDGYIKKENVYRDLAGLVRRIQEERSKETGIALVYHGNIVELWEYLNEKEVQVDLGSDQTSLHNIQDLGYCPAGYTFEEAEELLQRDSNQFMVEVRSSLRRHVDAVNKQVDGGMYFWDYGNAFLKEAGESDADIWADNDHKEYKYKSYVEDIMGPMCFDWGFGPFRWVCSSNSPEDLKTTDRIAEQVLRDELANAIPEISGQLQDNIDWISKAGEQIPQVGSKSRILYADSSGRIALARAFNQAIAKGELKGPVILGRDHHDVSGTDSPFRETANIYDGSKFTADMAVQNVIGDSFRGATWVSLHNGGGVGWGEVINGGFGLVLDGSAESERKASNMLHWDVNNGVARRAWARNPEALAAIRKEMSQTSNLKITLPKIVDEKLISDLF